MRTHGDIENTINCFGDAVWRACLLYFRPGPDSEDAFQETFLKYSLSVMKFNNDEHRKAWLIRVASNTCKDMLKASNRKTIVLDEACEVQSVLKSNLDQPDSVYLEVMDAMRVLDDPPRTPLYMAVYEGYTAPEISKILDAPVNTVYSWISRGKQQLKEALS